MDAMNFVTATAADSFRPGTEDRVAIHSIRGGLVVALADGAGGIPGGGEAADRWLALVLGLIAEGRGDPFASATWMRLLKQADAIIDADAACGETTAVVVGVSERGLVGASSGDSTAWIVSETGVDDLTAAQKRKLRLGSGRAAPVAFERPNFGGTLIVGSDGLFSYARAPDIARVVLGTDLRQAASSLIQLVRTPRSGDLVDDVAVALTRRPVA
jgi:serine/threonine protein phosphatase PrpC